MSSERGVLGLMNPDVNSIDIFTLMRTTFIIPQVITMSHNIYSCKDLFISQMHAESSHTVVI